MGLDGRGLGEDGCCGREIVTGPHWDLDGTGGLVVVVGEKEAWVGLEGGGCDVQELELER